MMDTTTWNYLPSEIIEKILLDVPATDMLFNKPWVCKYWTNILLQPNFWINKLRKIRITIDDEILSVLYGFERKIQIACLYHACLNENDITFKTVMNEDLPQDDPQIKISDDFEQMLKAASSLVTRSVDTARLLLNKEIIPVLPLLLKLLAVRGSCVTICDNYGFWNFSPRYEFVQLLKGPPDDDANIETFIGCVSTLNGLMKEDEYDEYNSELRLSIAVDENNKAIDPDIYDKSDVIQVMHIKAGTDVSTLKCKYPCLQYIISGLDSTHISWMTGLGKKLGLHTGYSLILLKCEIDKRFMIRLFHCWLCNDIEPVDIMCASSALNSKDARELNEIAHRIWMGCEVEYFKLFKSDQKLTQSKNFQDLLYTFNL